MSQSENQAPEGITPTKNNDPEWSGKWSISNVNSTAATSIAQQSNATLENKFDTVIITKVSKKRVQDASGTIQRHIIWSISYRPYGKVYLYRIDHGLYYHSLYNAYIMV